MKSNSLTKKNNRTENKRLAIYCVVGNSDSGSPWGGEHAEDRETLEWSAADVLRGGGSYLDLCSIHENVSGCI